MDWKTLTLDQRNIRTNIRNFLFNATMEELQQEKQISLEKSDLFRAKCIDELIDENQRSTST